MPHITLKMMPGRSEEQKQAVADALVKAAMEALGCREGALSVSVEDVPSGEWAEKVYAPEIRDCPQTLYKKPDYDPFA